MVARGDDRAVSNLIGAVFLIGTFVILFSVYQASIVPNQNEQVEFRHNQEVRGQLVDLRGAILTTAATDTSSAQRVTLGTTFPPRILALNPPPASGSLRTTDLDGTGVNILNAEATDAEVADFWDGTARSYDTSGLVYRPNYREYRYPPTTVYENSVLYNRFRENNLTATNQTLIDGRDLDLTVLQGSYQASQTGAVSVDLSSPAGDVRTVTVTRESPGNPVTVEIPTALPESAWRELLRAQLDSNGGYVTGISKSGDVLTLTLQETDASGAPIVYELEVLATGVGSNVPDPAPSYIVDVSGDGTEVETGETTTLVAEVRNDYSGPESGVTPTATASAGTATVTGPSDDDGRVAIDYTAPASTGTYVVTVERDFDGSGTVESDESAQFTVEVVGSGSGTGDSTSPVFTLGPTATPSTVDEGETFDLTATIDDSGRGGTDIVSATWSDNQGNSGIMTASDGEFDQPTEAVEAQISTAKWNPGDHNITVVGTDGNGNTVSSSVTVTVVENNDPYLSDLKITDNSGDPTRSGTRAKFAVEYSVTDPSGPATFKNVTVTFENLDAGGSTTLSSTSTDDTLNFEDAGNTAGQKYEITVRVYDTNGNMIQKESYTEEADGTSDNGDVI